MWPKLLPELCSAPYLPSSRPSPAPTHAGSGPFGTEIPAGTSLIAFKAELGLEHLAGHVCPVILKEHPRQIWGFQSLGTLAAILVPLESLRPKAGVAVAGLEPPLSQG